MEIAADLGDNSCQLSTRVPTPTKRHAAARACIGICHSIEGTRRYTVAPINNAGPIESTANIRLENGTVPETANVVRIFWSGHRNHKVTNRMRKPTAASCPLPFPEAVAIPAA
jgi:hypothetical protein